MTLVEVLEKIANLDNINLDELDPKKSTINGLTVEQIITQFLVKKHQNNFSAMNKENASLFSARNIQDLVDYATRLKLGAVPFEYLDVTSDEQGLWWPYKLGQLSEGDLNPKRMLRTSTSNNEVSILYPASKNAAYEYLTFLYQHNLYDDLNRKYTDLVLNNNILNADDFIRIKMANNKPVGKEVVPFDEYIHRRIQLIERKRFVYDRRPVSLISFDRTEPTFKYFDLELLQPGDYSAWQEFLDKFETKDHAEVWMEWLWSVFDKNNSGSQIMALQGEGGDGKSVVTSVLTKVIGEKAVTAVSDKDLKSDFWASNLYNKALVIWGDTKTNHPLSSEQVHQLTGRDMISVNIKNQPAFSYRFKGKLMMNTNNNFQIKDLKNEHRRIIYLRLRVTDEAKKRTHKLNPDGTLYKDKRGNTIFIGDNDWQSKLEDQAYSFLYECKKLYDERNNGANVELPEHIYDSMMEDIVDDDTFAEDRFYEVYETTTNPDDYIEKKDLHKFWYETLLPQEREKFFTYNNFVSWVKTQHPTKKKSINGKRVNIFTNIKKRGEDGAMSFSKLTNRRRTV